MKIPKNEYINLVIRLVVGTVFIITGIGKIVSPALFASDISHYAMVPYNLVNLMAIILPWIELFSGILFIFGVKIKANIILLAGMLLMFNIAVFIAMARGLNIDCGCFSNVASEKVGLKKLAENFAMLSGIAFIYIFPNNKFSIYYFKDFSSTSIIDINKNNSIIEKENEVNN